MENSGRVIKKGVFWWQESKSGEKVLSVMDIMRQDRKEKSRRGGLDD